jgi:hypothetical protein
MGSRPIITAAGYSSLDGTDGARKLAAKMLTSSPNLTLAYLRATQPYRDKIAWNTFSTTCAKQGCRITDRRALCLPENGKASRLGRPAGI